jgi:hypothetical protein
MGMELAGTFTPSWLLRVGILGDAGRMYWRTALSCDRALMSPQTSGKAELRGVNCW